MEVFSVKFIANGRELDAMVTAFDRNTQFKVEMVVNEPEPILLKRSVKGEWTIVRRGAALISANEFEQLQREIEWQLDQRYGVSSMLLLTDFSDVAFNTMEYAAALTQQIKVSRLILYHSYEYRPVITSAFAPVPLVPVYSHEETIRKLAGLKNQMEHLVPEGTEIEIRSDESTLMTAVDRFVAEEQVGLVVMGIEGRSNLDKILIGSSTITLAKACSVPLLIVPTEAKFKWIEKLVFACDLKKVSTTTPALAIKRFLHRLNAKLFILNVDPGSHHFKPDKMGWLTDLHDLWDDEKPEYHYTDNEDISTGIVEFADEHQAQLIMTVPKAHGFFESIFHRSVTGKLAYHTHLPLLLFKEDL